MIKMLILKKIVLTTKDQTQTFDQSFIKGKWAKDIRQKNVLKNRCLLQ